MKGQPGAIAYLQPQICYGSDAGQWFDRGEEWPASPNGIRSAAEQGWAICRHLGAQRWRVVEIVQRTIIIGATDQEPNL